MCPSWQMCPASSANTLNIIKTNFVFCVLSDREAEIHGWPSRPRNTIQSRNSIWGKSRNYKYMWPPPHCGGRRKFQHFCPMLYILCWVHLLFFRVLDQLPCSLVEPAFDHLITRQTCVVGCDPDNFIVHNETHALACVILCSDSSIRVHCTNKWKQRSSMNTIWTNY